LIYILLLIGFTFFGFFAYNVIVEPIYAFFFRKPIYVHFYPFSKKLSLAQLSVLHNQFDFYKKLSSKEKLYFEHRVAVFLKKYPFYGKEGLQITEEIRVLIAATAIML